MLFTIYFLAICKGKGMGPSYLRESLKMDSMRKLEEVELTELSFFISIYENSTYYLFSHTNIAIIDRVKCKFCKYVYMYKGTYDKSSKTYTFSNFILDGNKSSFYLDGTYCSLKYNEYTFTELSECNDALKYVENNSFPKPTKLVIKGIYEDELYLEDVLVEYHNFYSSILQYFYYYSE